MNCNSGCIYDIHFDILRDITALHYYNYLFAQFLMLYTYILSIHFGTFFFSVTSQLCLTI